MVIFGLILLAMAAVLVVGAAFLTDGNDVEYFGLSVEPLTMFVLGAVCVAMLWAGTRLVHVGTRRAVRARRDHKKVAELNERLAEAESRRDTDPRPTDDTPPPPAQ